MNRTLPLQIGLDSSVLLQQEDVIDRLLAFCDWDRPALAEDIETAVHLMVPVGCRYPLIRIGGNGDGAYLLPDDLEGISACFSPGRQFFSQRWLGSFDGGQTQSLDGWVLTSDHADAGDLLLQMDIEGAEYNCLLAASDSVLKRFRMIVVELHWLDLLGSARFLNQRALPMLRKLRLAFDCVHAHANNCCGAVDLGPMTVPRVLELTYYRRDRNTPPLHAWAPHPLDVVNMPANPPLPLGAPWVQPE
ncbi:MAG: FkbM family methyltransferase [Cyanobium sp. Prado107]|nr:FkbM family methyltransferase [Cyanobium sp. Prado107]